MYFRVESDISSSAGAIGKIKLSLIKKLTPLVKIKNKAFSVSLLGIGEAYSKDKKINDIM